MFGINHSDGSGHTLMYYQSSLSTPRHEHVHYYKRHSCNMLVTEALDPSTGLTRNIQLDRVHTTYSLIMKSIISEII